MLEINDASQVIQAYDDILSDYDRKIKLISNKRNNP